MFLETEGPAHVSPRHIDEAFIDLKSCPATALCNGGLMVGVDRLLEPEPDIL